MNAAIAEPHTFPCEFPAEKHLVMLRDHQPEVVILDDGQLVIAGLGNRVFRVPDARGIAEKLQLILGPNE